MLAWKQNNNGTTFVASPYRLPWLDEACSDWADDDISYLYELGQAKDLLCRLIKEAPASFINDAARRSGITMRVLRHAARALDIPWDQRRDIGWIHPEGVKVTHIDHGEWTEEQWEPNPTAA
jgi:hypothetical protein